MKKTASLSLDAIFSPIAKALVPIRRRLSFIVALAAIGALIYSFSVVSTILSRSDDEAYRQEQLSSRINSNFDKATIDKINGLTVSSEGASIDLPAGRRNPFVN